MSIDKWLNKGGSKEEKKKPENNYSEEQIQEGKKKKIRDLLGSSTNNTTDSDKKAINTTKIEVNGGDNDFLNYFIEFKNWLDQRTYLKGDLDKIETWVRNLYGKIESEMTQESKKIDKSEKSTLIQQFKEIPLTFLDEKTRIAVSKKLHGRKKTSSDTYYLRKLKTSLKEKSKEAQYYKILRKILEM